MTVQTNTNVASFNGNGVTQIFPIAFKFNNDTDLIVMLADDATGFSSLLTLNSDYTVSGEGDEEGGLINVVVAPAVGKRLFVSRVVDILQMTDLRNQGKFFAEVHEDAFDLLTMIAQQHQSDIARSLRVAEADPEPARIPSAVQRAGKLLAFDSAGNPTTALPVADSSTALRSDLASASGAEQVGYGAGTVADGLSGLQADVNRLDSYASWKFDPDLVALQETKHVVPVVGGGAFVDTRYDLAKELNFQRIPTRFTRHVGLTSAALENPDGSFMLITRQALGHANQTGASIVQYKTRYGSKVVPNFETSTVLDNAGVDDRDMSIGYMAGGRIGMVSSRPFAEQKPVFTYSDDNGATWASAAIATAPDVWTTWFGIHPWPASAGGSDTGGYICYGNTQGATPNEISCLYTTDNGATWTHAICLSGLGAEQPSEASVARVGDADLWVMVYRQNATTTGKARWSFSTDMRTWSAPVDGGLTMGKNPPYLFWHEGHMYLFLASRNSAFFGNISPDAKYANKLSYARTTAKKLVAGDLSDFDVLEPIASFGSLNGYLTLTRSPLTGKVFGAINYDEKSDGLVSSLSERSSLALVTDEKIVSPADAVIGSSIAFSGGTSWRVTRDQAAGILRAVGVSITLTSDGSGNRLFKSVAFPVTFQSADLETIPVLKGLTPGGSTVTRQGLGQLIVENVTTTGCDISLYRISAAGAFVSDSTAVVQLAVEGGYVRNDY